MESSFLDGYESNSEEFDIPSDPGQIQKYLEKNGIDVKYTTIKKIGFDLFEKAILGNSKYDAHQKAILRQIKDSMKGRVRQCYERFEKHRDHIDETLRQHDFPESYTAEAIRKIQFHSFHSILKKSKTISDDQKEVLKQCAELLHPGWIQKIEDFEESKRSSVGSSSTLEKNRQGRPRKLDNIKKEVIPSIVSDGQPQKRGRGRPRKTEKPLNHDMPETSASIELSMVRVVDAHSSFQESDEAMRQSSTEELVDVVTLDNPSPSSIHEVPFKKRKRLTDEDVKKLLKEHDLEAYTLDYLEDMGAYDFRYFLADGDFSDEQKEILKMVRKKLLSKNPIKEDPSLASTSRVSKSPSRGPSERSAPSSTHKKPRDHPNFAELQEALNKHRIDFEIEHLKTMKKSMFQEFLQYSGFTHEQKEVLVDVKHQLAHSRIVKKEKSLSPKPQKGKRGRKKKVEKMAPEKSLRPEAENADQSYAIEANDVLGIVKIEEEDIEDLPIPENSDPIPSSSHTQLFEQYDPSIEVQYLADGAKIFFKDSIMYPGHTFSYRFQSQVPKDAQSGELLDVYECNSCVETASCYGNEEARKYAMDTLKTVYVSAGRIAEGDYDGLGHVCVPIEMIRKRYNMC